MDEIEKIKKYWATNVQIDTDNLNRVLRNLAKSGDAPTAESDYWGLAVGYWQGCLLESEEGLRAARIPVWQ